MNLRRAIAGGTIAIGMAMTAHNANAAVVTVVTYTGTVAIGRPIRYGRSRSFRRQFHGNLYNLRYSRCLHPIHSGEFDDLWRLSLWNSASNDCDRHHKWRFNIF